VSLSGSALGFVFGSATRGLRPWYSNSLALHLCKTVALSVDLAEAIVAPPGSCRWPSHAIPSWSEIRRSVVRPVRPVLR